MGAFIKKTNKTILFEVFNNGINKKREPIPRMDYILDSNDGNINAAHKEIKEKLTVKSFEEFLDKFEPKYYQSMVKIEGQEIPEFEYYLEKPKFGAVEYSLVDQPFYKAMLELYTSKGGSGENNLEFKYNEIIDKMFSPEKAMKEVKDIRGKLFYNASEYFKIKARGGSKAEQKKYSSKVVNLLTKVKKDYLSKDPLPLLPLMIADLEDRLKNDITSDNKKLLGNSCECERVLMSFDDTGTPKYIPQKTDSNVSNSSGQALLDSSANNSSIKLIGWIEQDFENTSKDGTNHLVISGNDNHNNYMKNIFSSIFGGKSLNLSNVTRDKLEKILENYKQMYKSSQRKFAQALVNLVEKILNVKTFFDHAGDEAELIVSNCSIDDLLDNKNLTNFENFITREGEEQNDERVWFAIIPSVIHEDFVHIQGVDLGPDMDNYGFENESDFDNEDRININYTSYNSLKRMLDLLGKIEIISFFNFKGCSDTSFQNLSSNLVKDYKKELSQINPSVSDYSVFCYPNFTVLPEEFSYFKIGDEAIPLPPVYLDASYVACGLYVRCQNNDKLREKDFRVNDEYCPVRFNFEGSFMTRTSKDLTLLSQVFTTKLNRENILSMAKELKEEINKDGGFGFCFCGDQKFYDYNRKIGIEQKYAYVYKARTLGRDPVKDPDGNPTSEIRYRPIFKTLIRTYLTKISGKMSLNGMKNLCRDFTKDDNRANINNLLYSPKYSNVKVEEDINIDKLEKGIIDITYDKDRDIIQMQVNEN